MAEDEPEEQVAADGEQTRGGKSALTKKLIKITTVVVYACGVSSAGFLLSLYYIIFWDPQIKGVRPPDYLRGVEMEDYVGVASRPEAQMGLQPTTALPQTSKEFMDALVSNVTEEEIAAATSMREGQPTPNILPIIKDGYEAVHTAHHTPTQPLSAFRSDLTQGSGTDTSLGHSSHHQPHRTNSRDQQHYEQQQQRHHQQQQLQHHHQQQQQQQQQQALTALA
ncbi:homeobox protein abdominal-A isoform X1 [Procambarus clarkii]|uniref:homeobox protein abdominal-A isoform X1 n=1 Tax=Procambarus clarkii TaxID=6728 RepID=UPI003743DBEF